MWNFNYCLKSLSVFFFLSVLNINAQITVNEANSILNDLEYNANQNINTTDYIYNEAANNLTLNTLHLVNYFRKSLEVEDLSLENNIKLNAFLSNGILNLKEAFTNYNPESKTFNPEDFMVFNNEVPNNTPIITSFKTPLFTKHSISNQEEFLITFYGKHIFNRKNFLKINGNTVLFNEALEQTKNKVIFKLKKEQLPAYNNNIELALHLFKGRTEYIEPFNFRILPNKIASLKINYTEDYDCSLTFAQREKINICDIKKGECTKLLLPSNTSNVIDESTIELDYNIKTNRFFEIVEVKKTDEGVYVTVKLKDAFKTENSVTECSITYEEKGKTLNCTKTKTKQVVLKHSDSKIKEIPNINKIKSILINYNEPIKDSEYIYDLNETLAWASKIINVEYNPESKTLKIVNNLKE